MSTDVFEKVVVECGSNDLSLFGPESDGRLVAIVYREHSLLHMQPDLRQSCDGHVMAEVVM